MFVTDDDTRGAVATALTTARVYRQSRVAMNANPELLLTGCSLDGPAALLGGLALWPLVNTLRGRYSETGT